MSIASMYVRRTFKKSDDERDAGLTTPEDIRRFNNLEYGPNRNWQMLDVYRPKAAAGPLPVIVSVHGGAEDRNNRLLMRDLLPGKGTPEELEMISVPDHVDPNFPPVIVMTSYGDFLREQAPLLTDALRAVSVPVAQLFYGDENDPLGHVFHLNIRTPEAALCNDEECAFFRDLCV